MKLINFEIHAGVLQGDTLAPYLFIIVLDYFMIIALGNEEENLGFTIAQRRSRRHPAEILTDLDFADDIALLSDTLNQAQELLRGHLHGRHITAHCARRLNEPVSRLVFWCAQQGSRSQGRPRLTYQRLLTQGTDIHRQYLINLMQDRIKWRRFIMASDRGWPNKKKSSLYSTFLLKRVWSCPTYPNWSITCKRGQWHLTD